MRMRSISDETRPTVRVASTFRTPPDVDSGHAAAKSLLAFVPRET